MNKNILGLIVTVGLMSNSVQGLVTRDNNAANDAPNPTLGWGNQIQLFGGSATAIAPKYFITAKHVYNDAPTYNDVTRVINFNGSSYNIVGIALHPSRDLAIFKIQQTFSANSTVSTAPSIDISSALTTTPNTIIFGAGCANNTSFLNGDGTLGGWTWDAGSTTRQRWGTSAYYTDGNFLHFYAYASRGASDCYAVKYDSGGGVYYNNYLVGVLSDSTATKVTYQATPSSTLYYGALFNAHNIYYTSSSGMYAFTGYANGSLCPLAYGFDFRAENIAYDSWYSDTLSGKYMALRLNCGGSATSPDWAGDYGFSNGASYTTTANISTNTTMGTGGSYSTYPAPKSVYQSYRLVQGRSQYVINVGTASQYVTVRLHYAAINPYFNIGDVVFAVSINGNQVETNFDPLRCCNLGIYNTGYQRIYSNVVPDSTGNVTISFNPIAGNLNAYLSYINGIEIVPQ